MLPDHVTNYILTQKHQMETNDLKRKIEEISELSDNVKAILLQTLNQNKELKTSLSVRNRFLRQLSRTVKNNDKTIDFHARMIKKTCNHIRSQQNKHNLAMSDRNGGWIQKTPTPASIASHFASEVRDDINREAENQKMRSEDTLKQIRLRESEYYQRAVQYGFAIDDVIDLTQDSGSETESDYEEYESISVNT